MNRSIPLGLALLLGGCASQPPATPSSMPAAEARSPADVVASKLARAAGNPYELKELRFDFVVYAGGEEKVRRGHVWRPLEGTDTVRQGDEVWTVRDLQRGAPSDGDSPEAKAYAAWVNDVFWLLAPAKLMEPGVERSLEPDGRLTVTFSGVGLTPGDRYTYSYDADSGRVTAWAYTLESGRTGEYRWEDYASFGPLTISTRRPATDGSRELRMENIHVEP